jgi:hypothetical protein
MKERISGTAGRKQLISQWMAFSAHVMIVETMGFDRRQNNNVRLL